MTYDAKELRTIKANLSCWEMPIEFGELVIVDGKRYLLDGQRISKYSIRTTSIDGGYIRFVAYADRLVVFHMHRKRKGRRKLSDEQVRGIRQERIDGSMIKDIAAKYGITNQAVSQIANGHTYKGVV